MNQLSPTWRDRIWIVGSVLIALLVGVQIAQGGWVLAGGLSAVVILLILYRLDSSGLSKTVLVGLLAGYLIGNRGFAQFMPAPGLPLLPGEAGIAILLTLLFVEQSRGRSKVSFWAPLDALIIGWILFGVGRMYFDGRIYGILALRDFATVYYATFYFIARAATMRDAELGAILLATLRICAVPMAVLFVISDNFPGLFLDTLTFRGVPLIFFKADLVGLYAAIGAVLHYLRWEETGRKYSLIFCFGLFGLVMMSNNRAAMVALLVMCGWVVLSGRWRLAAWLGVGGVVGICAVLLSAQLRNESWETTPLFDIYEAVVSVTDPTGQGVYRGAESSVKGDNNLFRWVWWKLAISEAWHSSPIFGLGFGYDISAQFSREYFAGMANDFTARSPHSIFVTVFARMGLVGLSLFLGIVALVFHYTRNALISSESHELGAWAGAWAILASASFGVVLEGPMGAIVFWILLGIASGMSSNLNAAKEELAPENPDSEVPSPENPLSPGANE
ncbi:O-antigen ligase family protein [Opitutaceae bacterium]|nr:O-antigen ligase family protein [Opitutaceae bacterium]